MYYHLPTRRSQSIPLVRHDYKLEYTVYDETHVLEHKDHLPENHTEQVSLKQKASSTRRDGGIGKGIGIQDRTRKSKSVQKRPGFFTASDKRCSFSIQLLYSKLRGRPLALANQKLFLGVRTSLTYFEGIETCLDRFFRIEGPCK